MKKTIAVIMLLCMLSMALVGCSKGSNKFVGKWEGYKMATDGTSIVFEDYSSIVKMRLTAEFKSDGKYVLHYYVNGEEGDAYPQSGTYKMDGDKIKLSGDAKGGVGEIKDGELILSFSDGALKQYFKASK